MAVINTTVAKSRDVKDAALNLNAKAFEVRRTLAAVWDLKATAAKPPPPGAAASLDMRNESHESVVGEGDERIKVADVHFAPGGKYRSIVKLFIHYEFQKPDSWAMGTGWLIAPDIFATAGHCSYDWSHKMGRATEVKAYIGYKGRASEKDPNVQFRHVKRIVTTEGWVKTKGQKCFDVSFMQVEKPFSGITPIQFAETPTQGNMVSVHKNTSSIPISQVFCHGNVKTCPLTAINFFLPSYVYKKCEAESDSYQVLGVVGYPGDLSDPVSGEKGAFMHEMFLPTEFDLAEQADTMLQYQIDTFGGNSGSPVLRQSDLVSIGAHVYGGTYNSASVIGKYGNPYYDYIAAFGLPLPNDALNLVPVTGNTAISAPVPSGYGGQLPSSMGVSGARADMSSAQKNFQAKAQAFSRPQGQRGLASQHGALTQHRQVTPRRQLTQAEEEGFIDVLRKAASIGAPILGKVLNTALPIALGPIGGPVGALAGFALNTAGKLAAESASAESMMDVPNLQEGSMERAILAEAALSTIQSMELDPDLEESIFSDMKDMVMKALPVVRKAAPHVMGAMMEPALRIALDSLHTYNQKGGAESFEDSAPEPFRPSVHYSSAIDQPADRNAENFLQNVRTALQQGAAESALDGESEEGFIDIITAGVRFAGQGLITVAQHGLPLLADAILGAESFEAESASAQQPSQAFSADLLAHRALVAEAALQAVMKLPAQQLQEEGFFDFISDAVKTIAPVAMKMAPTIAQAIHPTVGKLIKGVLGQEFAMAASENGSTSRRRLASPPKLTSRKSLASLRQHHKNDADHQPPLPQNTSHNGYAQYGRNCHSGAY